MAGMSRFAKYLIGLALALPMGAYVAGSLVASASGEPERRDPVIIQDADPVVPSPDDGTRTPPPPPADSGEDDATRDVEEDVDDNGIRVVTPDPTRVDDRDDDDDQDDRDAGSGDDDTDDAGDDSRDDDTDD